MQVGRSDLYRHLSLFDAHLEVARSKLDQHLSGLHQLVVFDVHRQDSTLDAGTDRKEFPGHIGIISRFMRLVVMKRASHLQSSCNFPVQILAMDVLCYILSVLRRIEGDAAIPYGGLACFIPLAIVS